MKSQELWKEQDSAIKWQLSAIIAESNQLSRLEQRVLLFLFSYYDKQKQCINYPGHLRFSARHRVRPQALTRTLASLEQRGLILSVTDEHGSTMHFLANALLLEEAYERAKKAYPSLFAG